MDQQTKKRILWLILLITVPVFWGLGFVVVDDAVEKGIGAGTLLFCRFTLAGLLILCLRFCLKKTDRYHAFTKKDLIWGVLAGIFNFLGFYLQTLGTKDTDTAKVSMITGLYVVLVPLFYCFLNKKFHVASFLNVGIFFLGLCFLFDVWHMNISINKGDILVFVCAIFMAIQIIVVDKSNGTDPFNFTIIQLLVMGILGLTVSLVREYETYSTVNKTVIWNILYLGVFSSAYAYFVQTFAQRILSSTLSAILLSLEAMFGVIFSLIFGKAVFSAYLLIGSIIVVCACVLASLSETHDVYGGLLRIFKKNGGKKE